LLRASEKPGPAWMAGTGRVAKPSQKSFHFLCKFFAGLRSQVEGGVCSVSSPSA
jgi:hypothetical protein